MKILAIADIHSDQDLNIDFAEMGVDLVLTLGDVPLGLIELILLLKGSIPYVGINGNHDSGFVPPYADAHRGVIKIAGLTIGGYEGTPKVRNEKSRHAHSQRMARWKMWRMPPVDIFIAHSPPLGIHDRKDPLHTGFKAFNTYIERCQPRLFLHGHVETNDETLVGKTRVISVFGKRIIQLD